MYIISSTYFTIKLIYVIFIIISLMSFDDWELKMRNTILMNSSNFPKPDLFTYKDYLCKYLYKILNFIDYHLTNRVEYNDLPLIPEPFLNKLKEHLTMLDSYTKTPFYSAVDIHEKLKDGNTDTWNKETIDRIIIGCSWPNFKISYLWYNELIKIGYIDK